MLVALLLQAAIVSAPAEMPVDGAETARSFQELADRRSARLRACNQGLVYANGALVDGSSLYRRDQNPAKLQEPLWKPGEFPGEGLYAAVSRMVDGCPVPTPIAYRNGTPTTVETPVVRPRIKP